MALTVIVVPEGLRADSKGTPLPEPSFVFRAVLERVIADYSGGEIYIAPANDFGCVKFEEEVARDLLCEHGLDRVFIPDRRVLHPQLNYIDTMGNARVLRNWLQRCQNWPLPPITLVVAQLHATRSAFCFQHAGFAIEKVVQVPYEVANEYIVGRLFYYKHPLLHVLYEKLALQRDKLKAFFGRT